MILDVFSMYTAAELAHAYRTKWVTPTLVVEVYLARIKALNEFVHAFVDVFEADAVADAEAATQRFAIGAPLGELDGIPIAIKDLVEIQGKVCTAGSAGRLDYRSQTTAPIVTTLRAQGAIILGKTHTVEFALGGWGTNEHMGAPRNPWSVGVPLVAGGSSSGSAVAVSACLAVMAVGTDTGGSVRVPAAFNGLVGLKTTIGLVDCQGVTPLSPTLDSVGPLARCVWDAALLFLGLLGGDAARSASADVLTGLVDGVAGLTLATLDSRDRAAIDPDILDAYDETLRQFEALGATLVPMGLPRPLASYGDCFDIALAEAYALHGRKAEDPSYRMDSAVRTRILSGAMPARIYIDACARAKANASEFLAAMQGKDAFVLPTAPVTPIALSDVDEATTPATLTRFVNQLGLCALAVPNGADKADLPTSVQIVCRPFHEALALRIGYAFEQSTEWHRRIPQLVAG